MDIIDKLNYLAYNSIGIMLALTFIFIGASDQFCVGTGVFILSLQLGINWWLKCRYNIDLREWFN